MLKERLGRHIWIWQRAYARDVFWWRRVDQVEMEGDVTLDMPVETNMMKLTGSAVAARVLDLEAMALTVLARQLDSQFDLIVERISSITGRVIVTGMGKSGHVGRKIASTFASTGTPALFVHPAEASHGDLGMIALTDLVISLSNSGNTSELASIITYSRRFGIPLVAVTSQAKSALAEHADFVLLLPPMAEACPHGLAPTTSTTMMMALGDALAIALLERRGFTAEDYGMLHPGGQLGRALLRIGDIMHGPQALPLVACQATMSDAILEMSAKRFGCVGIINEASCLMGIITDGDLRRHMSDDLLRRSVTDVMTRTPQTIRAGALVAEALNRMNSLEIVSLFVVDQDRRPIGIVHMHDCMRVGVV